MTALLTARPLLRLRETPARIQYEARQRVHKSTNRNHARSLRAFNLLIKYKIITYLDSLSVCCCSASAVTLTPSVIILTIDMAVVCLSELLVQ